MPTYKTAPSESSMSSIIGHLAAGAAVHLSRSRCTDPQARTALPLLLFLAIAPDLDYLPLWLLGTTSSARFSHSLLFCLALSTVIWLLFLPVRRKNASFPGWLALFIASCSHLVLDMLVGLHPLPLLWPCSFNVSMPVGLLPSAGKLQLANYYLWRNLLIESGVLLPVLWFVTNLFRGRSIRSVAAKTALVAPVWAGFLVWSIAIHG